MDDLIDISKLDKAAVLAALYNASRPQGLGFLHATPQDMTTAEAATHLETQDYFDYLNGRVMKIDLSPTSFEKGLAPFLYDRDLGQGATQRALQPLIDAAA